MDSLEIVKRFDALDAQRKPLESTLEIIERFVIPLRSGFFQDLGSEGEVDWRLREIYDGTAIEANETLAASLQGSLTPITTRWFHMQYRQDALNKDRDAMMWLEQASDIAYQALLDSNFNLEVSEFYLELTSYGSSILFEEWMDDPYDQGLDFKAMPTRDSYFEVDHRQNCLRFYRRYRWTPLQIIDKFGVEKVPSTIVEASKNPSQNDVREDVIFCVYLRPDKKDKLYSIKPLAPEERPVGWKYVLKKDGTTFDGGSYYEMPAFVARWRKVAGSQFGYSPAFVCLSDILTLNELKQEILEALGKVVDPATLVTERNLLSDVDLGRGGMTVVRDLNGIGAYESKARFDVSELKVQQLQQAINRAFRVDQLQLKESPAMTATEVQVRYELMQRLMGPTLGRLQHDFLDPMLKRTFAILMRNGQIPMPPPVVQEAGAELDIQYTGPLPRAQRQDTLMAVNSWVAMMAQLMQVYPELRDIPDIDRIGRGTAELAGIPADMLRSDKEVRQIREARQKMEAMMAQIQAAQAEGEAMKAQGEGRQAMAETEANNPEIDNYGPQAAEA